MKNPRSRSGASVSAGLRQCTHVQRFDVGTRRSLAAKSCNNSMSAQKQESPRACFATTWTYRRILLMYRWSKDQKWPPGVQSRQFLYDCINSDKKDQKGIGYHSTKAHPHHHVGIVSLVHLMWQTQQSHAPTCKIIGWIVEARSMSKHAVRMCKCYIRCASSWERSGARLKTSQDQL